MSKKCHTMKTTTVPLEIQIGRPRHNVLSIWLLSCFRILSSRGRTEGSSKERHGKKWKGKMRK